MGLSNGERLGGLYAVADRLYLAGAELKRLVGGHEDSHCLYGENLELAVRIAAECEAVWTMMLGAQSNSIHWLFGSSSGNTLRHEDGSPWGRALASQVEDYKAAQRDSEESSFGVDAHKEFCAFDAMLSIHGLLSGSRRELAFIFDIYGVTETAIYYLRRYRDAFMAGYPELDRAISTIQGLCHGIFRRNEEFLRAYLVHATAVVIYGSEHYQFSQDQDPAVRWLADEHIHHDLPWAMDRDCGLERVVKTHKWLVGAYIAAGRDSSAILLERICAALMLAGPRFHYQHKHQQLLRIASDSGLETSYIQGLLRTATRMHAEDEEARRSRHAPGDRELEIYGY